jgi:hypothetical protein
MKTETLEYIFDYTFHQVGSVFYNRYPNSYAKHIISEDVISQEVDEDRIYTKKLIVKQGLIFLNNFPSPIY